MTYSAYGGEYTTPFDPAPASGQTFSDSATGTNTVGSTKNWTSGFGFPGGATTSMTINVTVKGTWMGSDPVPPSVMVIETVHLDQDGANEDGSLATGTLDDSFGDQPVVVWRNNGTFDQTCGTPAGIPIAHQTIKSGSTFTLTDTFKVSSSATAHGYGSCSAAAHFNGYTAIIHAQPYNFRLGDYSDPNSGDHPNGVGKNSNGDLHFHYIWNSTDGNIADPTTCKIYEHVSATGNTPASFSTQNGTPVYSPPNPPFNYTIDQEIDQPDPNQSGFTPGTQGYQDDYQFRGSYIVPTFVDQFGANNYTDGSYFTTQDWQFNDSATGQTHVELLGPITITRSVTGSSTPWVYTVSKSSFSNTFNLP